MTAQYNPQIPGNVCTDKFFEFFTAYACSQQNTGHAYNVFVSVYSRLRGKDYISNILIITNHASEDCPHFEGFFCTSDGFFRPDNFRIPGIYSVEEHPVFFPRGELRLLVTGGNLQLDGIL